MVTGARTPEGEGFMKTINGYVTFEGKFQGISADKADMLEGMTAKLKIEMDQKKPPAVLVFANIYPSTASLPTWREAKKGKIVRFRAKITGIAAMASFIRSQLPRGMGYVALLEDAEPVQ